jgi:hypothetical protein
MRHPGANATVTFAGSADVAGTRRKNANDPISIGPLGASLVVHHPG